MGESSPQFTFYLELTLFSLHCQWLLHCRCNVYACLQSLKHKKATGFEEFLVWSVLQSTQSIRKRKEKKHKIKTLLKRDKNLCMQWRINLQDWRYCMTSTHTQAKKDISVTRTKKLALKVDYTLRANTSPLRVKAA